MLEVGRKVRDLFADGCSSPERLRACVRPTDTVARLGGDEFTILLNDLKDVSQASVIAQIVTADPRVVGVGLRQRAGALSRRQSNRGAARDGAALRQLLTAPAITDLLRRLTY